MSVLPTFHAALQPRVSASKSLYKVLPSTAARANLRRIDTLPRSN